MKHLLLLLIACSSTQFAVAQTDVLSKIPASGTTIEDFIPVGYAILDQKTGDLNKDSIADVVLVLKSKIEDVDTISVFDDVDRLFLILFKTANGYSLAAKTSTLVTCKTCGGMAYDPYDPEGGLRIEKGSIILILSGGGVDKWNMERRFRYQNGDFYLIGMTDERYNNTITCDDGSNADLYHNEVNLITGDRVLKKVSEDCKVLTDKKDKIAKKPLIKLTATNLKEYQF